MRFQVAIIENGTEFAAKFDSNAHTGRGIVRAAQKALEAKYGREFEVTAHDIAERIHGADGKPMLRYIDTMQKQGLWQ